jgi:hypothetical protein
MLYRAQKRTPFFPVFALHCELLMKQHRLPPILLLHFPGWLLAVALWPLFAWSVCSKNYAHAAEPATTILERGRLDYTVGFLGGPSSSIPFEMTVPVPWTAETVAQLKKLGFNTIQINVAWGPRPADEVLNVEDVVGLNPEQDRQYPQVVPLRCKPGVEARENRRAELRRRIVLCKQAGLRTLFHFGAPYNAHATYGDGPPNCIMDENVIHRYELLLDAFAHDFPGVDDLLVYTYDQDAWLCSEFGPCPRCLGVPLHKRLVPFLNRLAARWQNVRPQGRLWWEPWELSAGQSLACTETIDPRGLGLMLHCNIAEVIGTMPVDRWLKNNAALAQKRGIPVIVEYWLGGPSEELESYFHLAHPLVTLRGLKTIASVPGVVGVKEYYGLNPTVEDPNLRMSGLFFHNPAISEAHALRSLAKPYGAAAGQMTKFWQLTSEGMELFPWETTWFIREPSRSRTDHSLSAAMLRGQQCHTPAWESSRHAIFMKTDNGQPDPWMLEDVELRCQLAADRWETALKNAQEFKKSVPEPLADAFNKNLVDLAGLRRRSVTYALHLRETNLATILRKAAELKLPRPQKSVDELLAALQADMENNRAEFAAAGHENKQWPEMRRAITLLEKDPEAFLKEFLKEDPDQTSKGVWSITSR